MGGGLASVSAIPLIAATCFDKNDKKEGNELKKQELKTFIKVTELGELPKKDADSIKSALSAKNAGLKLDELVFEISENENKATVKAKADSKSYEGTVEVSFSVKTENSETTVTKQDLSKVITKTDLGELPKKDADSIKSALSAKNAGLKLDELVFEISEKENKATVKASDESKTYTGEVVVAFSVKSSRSEETNPATGKPGTAAFVSASDTTERLFDDLFTDKLKKIEENRKAKWKDQLAKVKKILEEASKQDQPSESIKKWKEKLAKVNKILEEAKKNDKLDWNKLSKSGKEHYAAYLSELELIADQTWKENFTKKPSSTDTVSKDKAQFESKLKEISEKISKSQNDIQSTVTGDNEDAVVNKKEFDSVYPIVEKSLKQAEADLNELEAKLKSFNDKTKEELTMLLKKAKDELKIAKSIADDIAEKAKASDSTVKPTPPSASDSSPIDAGSAWNALRALWTSIKDSFNSLQTYGEVLNFIKNHKDFKKYASIVYLSNKNKESEHPAKNKKILIEILDDKSNKHTKFSGTFGNVAKKLSDANIAISDTIEKIFDDLYADRLKKIEEAEKNKPKHNDEFNWNKLSKSADENYAAFLADLELINDESWKENFIKKPVPEKPVLKDKTEFEAKLKEISKKISKSQDDIQSTVTGDDDTVINKEDFNKVYPTVEKTLKQAETDLNELQKELNSYEDKIKEELAKLLKKAKDELKIAKSITEDIAAKAKASDSATQPTPPSGADSSPIDAVSAWNALHTLWASIKDSFNSLQTYGEVLNFIKNHKDFKKYASIVYLSNKNKETEHPGKNKKILIEILDGKSDKHAKFSGTFGNVTKGFSDVYVDTSNTIEKLFDDLYTDRLKKIEEAKKEDKLTWDRLSKSAGENYAAFLADLELIKDETWKANFIKKPVLTNKTQFEAKIKEISEKIKKSQNDIQSTVTGDDDDAVVNKEEFNSIYPAVEKTLKQAEVDLSRIEKELNSYYEDKTKEELTKLLKKAKSELKIAKSITEGIAAKAKESDSETQPMAPAAPKPAQPGVNETIDPLVAVGELNIIWYKDFAEGLPRGVTAKQALDKFLAHKDIKKYASIITLQPGVDPNSKLGYNDQLKLKVGTITFNGSIRGFN